MISSSNHEDGVVQNDAPQASTASSPKADTTQPGGNNSNSNGSHQKDTDSTLTAEERLQALQEKTNTWKSAVATQLKDAAAKNKSLRDELRAAREERDADLVALRLQLNGEFKERTQMLRDEVAEMKGKVEELCADKVRLAQTHAEDLKAAEKRVRETCRFDADKERELILERHQKDLDRLQLSVDQRDKQLTQAEHDAKLLNARLERLGAQYEELTVLIHSEGNNGSNSPSQGLAEGVGAAVSDAAHQQQLEAVRSELAGKEQHARHQLEGARLEHENMRQQSIREIQAREQQIAVLHSLLKQAQDELRTSHERISRAQAEAECIQQNFTVKVSSLTAELAKQLELLESSQRKCDEVSRQLRQATATIEGLEEDAASREEALRMLMLSEDDKQLVQQLQRAVHLAREDAEDWKIKYMELQASSTAQAPLQITPDEQLTRREAALAQRTTELDHKATLLRATEVKLEELKRSVAEQARTVLLNSNNSNNSSTNKRAAFQAESGGGSGSSNAAGREPSWARWALLQRRALFTMRTRTLVMFLCVVIVVIMMISAMTVSSQPPPQHNVELH